MIIAWLIAGAVLVIFEFVVFPGIGFLFAGLGALIVGVLAESGLVTDPLWQWLIFFASSLILAVTLWKPLANFRLNKGESKNFSDMVGHKAKLASELNHGKMGKAKWSGTVMNAKLDESATGTLPEGAEVVITRVEGNTLIVK